jgi:hypothetical protein
VFGIPGSRGARSWRFEGHHVFVRHTIVDGLVVASTPLFLGASPTEVRHYYRLHGPSMLVEYEGTQDGANHVHSV